MKAADIFSTLLAEPVAPEGAAPKDAAAADAFDALLNEAVDQDAAKQGGQTAAESKGLQTEQTVAREQTIVVPSGPLSIHGSISRGLREKGVGSPREALASAPTELAVGIEASTEGATSPVRGERTSRETVLVAETEASDVDYDTQDDSAAMQNVLGHVAAAIARIVAPSEPSSSRTTAEVAPEELANAGDASGAESGRARAAFDAGSAQLAPNEVVLEQPEALAGEKFVLPQESAQEPSPSPGRAQGSAESVGEPGLAVRSAANGIPQASTAAAGAAQKSVADNDSGASAGRSMQHARAADAAKSAPKSVAEPGTSGQAAARFAVHPDGGRAAYAAQSNQAAPRGHAAAQPRAAATQALPMDAPLVSSERGGARFDEQTRFAAAAPGQAKEPGTQVELPAAAVASDPRSAAQLSPRAPLVADAAQGEPLAATSQSGAGRPANTPPDNAAAASNQLLGAAFAGRSAARAHAGSGAGAADTKGGQGVSTNSAAMQRAQLDRAGVRFESTPALANEPSAPAAQVSFETSGEEPASNLPATRSYGTAGRPAGFAASPVRAEAGIESVPASSATASGLRTATAQTPSAAVAGQAVKQATAAHASAPVQVRVDLQGAPVPQTNMAASAQPSVSAQRPASNVRAAAQGGAGQGTQPASSARTQQPVQANQTVQADLTVQANPTMQASVSGQKSPNDAQRLGAAPASAARGEPVAATQADGNRATRTTDNASAAAGRGHALPANEQQAIRADGVATRELEPRAEQVAPVQTSSAARMNAAPETQARAAQQATQPAAQPAQAAPVMATPQLEQAAVAVASTREEQGSGDKPRAAKGGSDPMTRVEGFSRGARFGAALSAYSGRGHENAEHDTRGKRSEEREREVSSEKSPTESFTQAVDQSVLLQPTPTVREAPPPESAARTPAVPVAVPVPEQTDIEFSRTPVAQPQNASISLHHPDLGPIQIQVQRLQDRVEVSAVIESAHAEAVLRANESGIRIGVQQSGMTFGALKVKLRGQERERDKDNARPGQERRRRGIERGI